MKSRTFVFPFLFALALSGCAGQRPSNNAAAPTPLTGIGQTASSPEPKPTGPLNTAANTAMPPDEAEHGLHEEFKGTAGITEKKSTADQPALLTAVRTGQQDNFDRIVFEFAGGNLPGYHLEYIDKPVRSCGSGDVVPLRGDGWLEIRFMPANGHTENGEPTVRTREMAPNHKIIKELKATCDFEADVEWVAGLASPNRYRILELKDPTRLVVDIKH